MVDRIIVETMIAAPVEQVYCAYTSPDDITKWNAASDDWHTTKAVVDLSVGGSFVYRMEAKDGSIGFDFAGTFTHIIPNRRIDYSFGDRNCEVEFLLHADGVVVRVSFDPEDENPIEMQRSGWQAILNNFKKFVEAQGV